jgi:hypothetical protein
LMGQELSSLDFNELGHLEHQLEMSLKSIRTRKVFVRIQMWLVNLASIRTELNEWYIREMKLEIMCNSLGCPDFMSYITRSFMYLQGLIYSDEINELHKKRFQESGLVYSFRWLKGFPPIFFSSFHCCHCREASVVKKMKNFIRRYTRLVRKMQN